MEISTIIYILVSLFLIVDGVYSVVKGAPIFPGNNDKVQREKYTNTYNAAHKVFGLGIAIGGICFLVHEASILFSWFDSYALLFVGLAFVIIGLVFYYLVLKGTIKKEPNKVSSQEKIKPEQEKSDDGISGYDN